MTHELPRLPILTVLVVNPPNAVVHRMIYHRRRTWRSLGTNLIQLAEEPSDSHEYPKVDTENERESECHHEDHPILR
jgi:hypothetical protein